MAHWNLTVSLSDLIDRWKSGEFDIPELARLVVKRIKESEWRKITPYPDSFDQTLDVLLRASSKGEYSAAFEEIYDLADSDRVWIVTRA